MSKTKLRKQIKRLEKALAKAHNRNQRAVNREARMRELLHIGHAVLSSRQP